MTEAPNDMTLPCTVCAFPVAVGATSGEYDGNGVPKTDVRAYHHAGMDMPVYARSTTAFEAVSKRLHDEEERSIAYSLLGIKEKPLLYVDFVTTP